MIDWLVDWINERLESYFQKLLGKGRSHCFSSLPLPHAYKHLCIYLQFCIWNDELVFLIVPHVITWLLLGDIYPPPGHCVKSVQIRSFFWFVFSRIRTEYGEIRSSRIKKKPWYFVEFPSTDKASSRTCDQVLSSSVF